MGEAKRRQEAAQAAGRASTVPLQLSPSDSARLAELQTRSEEALVTQGWAQQRAEGARQALLKEFIRILEDHDVEIPDEEQTSWRWNHKVARRQLTWRIVSPPAGPGNAGTAGTTSEAAAEGA